MTQTMTMPRTMTKTGPADNADNAAILEAPGKSEERLQLVVQATDDLLWDFDFASGALWWSPSYNRNVGLPESTPPTVDLWLSLIHPDDVQRVLANTVAMDAMEAN